jgi:hypothetical protein
MSSFFVEKNSLGNFSSEEAAREHFVAEVCV